MHNAHIRFDHRARGPAPRGFTLIELMITVAIIAILAAVALPSYESYLRSGRRADAQSFMQEAVARQQHFLLDRRAYATDLVAVPASGGLGLTLPANVSAHYTLTLATNNAAAPPSYTLTATPQGKQANDKCGTMTIDQRGTKTPAGGCW